MLRELLWCEEELSLYLLLPLIDGFLLNHNFIKSMKLISEISALSSKHQPFLARQRGFFMNCLL